MPSARANEGQVGGQGEKIWWVGGLVQARGLAGLLACWLAGPQRCFQDGGVPQACG